jgi:hypothetical protein
MAKLCINWNKVLANGGIAFFTTLTATRFTGDINALEISVINALLITGLALFTELKVESEQDKPKRTITRVQKIVSAGLLF